MLGDSEGRGAYVHGEGGSEGNGEEPAVGVEVSGGSAFVLLMDIECGEVGSGGVGIAKCVEVADGFRV